MSRIRCAVFAAASAACLVAPAGAQSFTNDFDHIFGATAFNLLTPHLQWGPSLELDGARYFGGVILRDILWDDAATSGDNLLASCDQCFIGNPGEYFLPGYVSIAFDEPRDQLDADLINGVSFASANFRLRAFDADGALILTQLQAVGAAGTPGGVQHVQLRAPGMQRVVYDTLLPEGHTFALDTVVHRSYESVITDLGQALPGSGGAPELELFGSLKAGEPLDLSLRQGVPGGTAIPVLGASAIHAPFKQGVMVPAPDFLLPALPLDAAGELDAVFAFPAGVPAGFSLYLQAWLPDVGAPAGFAASNALQATTPPS